MSPRMKPQRQHPSASRGFSLVELMIVIVIISLLLALLLPAIGAVRSRLRDAEVKTEITSFETAITQFVGEFGQEPPSSIILYEAPDVGTGSADPSWFQDSARTSAHTQSRTMIRQLWPQFNFGQPRDLNDDGDATDFFVLTGDECLLFFLGGVGTITDPSDTSAKPVADGFSKNPQNPFASGGTRTGPFVANDFDPVRMTDDDGDGAHAYAHKYPSSRVAYLYLSSYGGRGYRAGDADIDGNNTPDITDVYLQRDDDPSTTNENEKLPWKDKTYQIISAGLDEEFGIGGLWSSENGFGSRTGVEEDRDNITNFSGGTLE